MKNFEALIFMFISSVNDTYEIGELNDINVTTPSKSSWHLSNLNATTKYKFYLKACTSKGCGKPISEESATLGEGSKYMMLLHAVVPHNCTKLQVPPVSVSKSSWPSMHHRHRYRIYWSVYNSVYKAHICSWVSEQQLIIT